MKHQEHFCSIPTASFFKQITNVTHYPSKLAGTEDDLQVSTVHNGRLFQVYLNDNNDIHILKCEAFSPNGSDDFDGEHTNWDKFSMVIESLTMAQIPPIFELPKVITDRIREAHDLCPFSELWIEANEAYQNIINDVPSQNNTYNLIEEKIDVRLAKIESSSPELFNKWITANI